MLRIIMMIFMLSVSCIYSFTLDSLDFDLVKKKGEQKILEKSFEVYNDSSSKKEYSFLLEPINNKKIKYLLKVSPKNIILEPETKANFKIEVLKNKLEVGVYEYYFIINENNLESVNKAVLNKKINIRQKFIVGG